MNQFNELLKDLRKLVDEADTKARNNKHAFYEERAKGQLDVALDLQRIIEKYENYNKAQQ